jgi:dihydroorotate dehydrogenase (NAD+) catalytic subunit
VAIPVIGLGGIACLEDLLEFIMAGASAVSVGTMNMVDPALSITLIEKLEQYMKSENMEDIRQIIGAAHAPDHPSTECS